MTPVLHGETGENVELGFAEERGSGSMPRQQRGSAGGSMKKAMWLTIAVLTAAPAFAQDKGGGNVSYKK